MQFSDQFLVSQLRLRGFSSRHVATSAGRVHLLESNYQEYARRLEQARIDHALQQDRITNVTVVQPSTLSLKPVSPKKTLVVALAAMLAACGGLGVVILAAALDPTFRSADPHVELVPRRNGWTERPVAERKASSISRDLTS